MPNQDTPYQKFTPNGGTSKDTKDTKDAASKASKDANKDKASEPNAFDGSVLGLGASSSGTSSTSSASSTGTSSTGSSISASKPSSPPKDETSTARSVATSVKDAAEQAVAGASDIAHEAREVVVDGYHASADYLEEKAHQIGETASDIVDTVATQAVRTARSTKGFVGANLLPLLVVGTGLSWLALRLLSTRPQPRREPRLSPRRRLPREPRVAADNRREAPVLSASTPSGAKLMGVRVHDTGYVE